MLEFYYLYYVLFVRIQLRIFLQVGRAAAVKRFCTEKYKNIPRKVLIKPDYNLKFIKLIVKINHS